jgi:hypothetical protein
VDEQKAPLFAFWQHGVGRAAAFLGEVDGEYSGALPGWPRYGDVFATTVRWLAGNDASHEVFADFVRQGHEGVLRVEVEKGREALLGQVVAQLIAPAGDSQPVLLERTGERTLEARVPLGAEGIYRAALQVGDDQFVRLPPLALPYSPEFEPRLDPRFGATTLARISAITGGKSPPQASDLFSGLPPSAGIRLWTWACGWLLLAVWLLEIAVRRLGLRLPRLAVVGVVSRRATTWLRGLRVARPKTATRATGTAVRTPAPTDDQTPSPEPRPSTPSAPAKPPQPNAASGMTSILDRAKARAKRRS